MSLAASIPLLFPRPAKPVRVNAPMTYRRYANDPRKFHVAEHRDSLQGTAARATPTVSARDPLSLLRASFVDSSVPVYTSAGTTLPTYTTLAPPINADHLAQLPLDLSTGASVVASTHQRVQLHVLNSFMTAEIASILERVQTTTTTASEI